MGLFDSVSDFVFGEAPDTRTKRKTTKTPEQEQLLRDLISKLQSGDLQSGAIDDNMKTSLTALENWANSMFEGGEAVTSKEGRAGTAGIQDVMSRGPQDFDKYFTESVEKPLFETFNEDIMPGISRGFAPSGFWSSQRTEAQGRAREDLIETLGSERAKMGYQTYADDLDRILEGGSQLLRTGTQMQGVAGDAALAGADRRFGRIDEAQRRKESEMSLMLAALGVTPFENIATVSGGQQGLIPSMAGGVGQGLGYGLGANLWT